MGRDKKAQRTKGNKQSWCSLTVVVLPHSRGTPSQSWCSLTVVVLHRCMGTQRPCVAGSPGPIPSSSGRSADLLGSSTTLGFSGLQDLGFVPASSQCHDDSAVAATFRVALRKMTKKDATTKIKALQEFEALCRVEGRDATLSALAFWPRLYAKLATDVERREAFSKDKRAEVILFTLSEIFGYLSDMLFVQTPQTLSDPK
ncbi:E3 ubiquitin-protein ligase listerin [Chionoecetes opilio]|uniref:E3 ubiquitin-protein ligase listerin n=1 Tax=Chionoecetes opilio TaxID=41210 RepID=A0A8J5D445_CHIOP|nr:E3 ubiquitin-protein ligase listerin [Chionoecetes opilio]